MSNYLAIATVTETLRQLLEGLVSTAVNGAIATAVRPSAANTVLPNQGVNVFLYEVSPNAAGRNLDLPNRRDDGSLANRPRVALDLHYLLTFYGQDNLLVPQRLLGRAVQALHAQPVLTRQQIRSVTNTVEFLNTSNLADEVELVKFTPLPLSLEELSKLWSVFFQTAYVLSVAYLGTLVLIEGDEAPRQALPVRERAIRVLPFQRPVIDEISPQILEPGETLTIRGQNLGGNLTKVLFRRTAVTPATVTPSQIEVKLPAGLAAGVNTAQVVQSVDFKTGSPAEPHRCFESNVAAFILAPKINQPPHPEPFFGKVAHGTDFTLEVTPPIERTQDVRLLLDTYTIALPPRPASEPPTTTSLKFKVPSDFPTGEFMVRIQVDGAQSKLEADDVKGYTGPKVVIICKCFRCTAIALNSSALGVEGLVTVKDENAAAMEDSEVAITWTLPNGTTQDDKQKTDNTGVAKFTLIGGSGNYVLAIKDIVKTGFVFDQQKSTLSQRILK